jgi:extracellular elastinolytic metalloproteinase
VNRAIGEGNVSPGSGLPREMIRFPRELDSYGFPPDGTLPAAFPDDWVATINTDGNPGSAGFFNAQSQFTVLTGTQQNDLVIFDPSDGSVDFLGILNLFYYNCFMHDFFYLLGFREKDGNFQKDNFGRGGKENDALQAIYWPGLFPTGPGQPLPEEGASMFTPVDGKVPTMNASLIASTGRHTAFDSTIIFHEFTHGVTN